MALSARDQVKYWGIAAAVLFVLLWWMGNIIMPFILGGALAFILDPLADRLEKLGLSRALATTIISVAAVLIFVAAALVVIPALIDQTTALIESAPKLAQNLQQFLSKRFPGQIDAESAIRQALGRVGVWVQQRGGELMNGLLMSVSGIVNALVLFVIVPVVAFYLLLDWDNMVRRIDGLLPRDHAPTIRRLASEVNRTLAAFIRGQGLVCLILGTYYAVALMAIGLQFGLVVGAIAGVLTFIPYIGAIVGGVLAIGLALFQFWGDWIWIVAVAAIFQSGQLIEGNVLTPKLVGSSVGLHPVWLLFALAAFGGIFGFVGMLVAVPVAAALGVLARFALAEYKDSSLYRGSAPDDAPAAGHADDAP